MTVKRLTYGWIMSDECGNIWYQPMHGEATEYHAAYLIEDAEDVKQAIDELKGKVEVK